MELNSGQTESLTEAFLRDPWGVLRDVLSPSMVRLMEILGQINEESIASMARMVELAGHWVPPWAFLKTCRLS